MSTDVIQASKSLIAFSFGLPFFMMMKVLVPAFFSRKDTKTPMYAAIAALALNIALNYYLAFFLGYGHTGLAFASSVSALLSCGILYIILIKDNYIQFRNPINRFNLALALGSLSIILFLLYGPFNMDFDSLSFLERLFNLSLEVVISIFLYLLITRAIIGGKLRELF